jgi:chaperone modulatory protein CbpM
MKRNIVKIYEGILMEEDKPLSISKLSERCMISEIEIEELVYEGVIEPLHMQEETWSFSSETLWRLRKVQRLRRDLDLNIPGAALTMQLLDRIAELENMIKTSTD